MTNGFGGHVSFKIHVGSSARLGPCALCVHPKTGKLRGCLRSTELQGMIEPPPPYKVKDQEITQHTTERPISNLYRHSSLTASGLGTRCAPSYPCRAGRCRGQHQDAPSLLSSMAYQGRALGGCCSDTLPPKQPACMQNDKQGIRYSGAPTAARARVVIRAIAECRSHCCRDCCRQWAARAAKGNEI